MLKLLYFYVENDKLNMIKGDRHSIGYKKSDANYEFKEHVIEVEEGMKFYITTDGYLDQNGGEKGFPFGKKRFKSLIQETQSYNMHEQKQLFCDKLLEYQGDNERNDDMNIVAFEIKEKK